MVWNDLFSKENKPELSQIREHIDSPLWDSLCTFLETDYSVSPLVEYSRCGSAPGWNVKYRKGGRSLCTLYPQEHFFTCLVSIGSKEAAEAEALLPTFSPYLQELYQKTTQFNGSRWLMIDVTEEKILEDAERLIAIRAPKKKQ